MLRHVTHHMAGARRDIKKSEKTPFSSCTDEEIILSEKSLILSQKLTPVILTFFLLGAPECTHP